MAPTGEDREDCEEQEEIAPLNMEVVDIKSLEEVQREKSKDQEIKQDPGDQESSLPFPHAMTRETGNSYDTMLLHHTKECNITCYTWLRGRQTSQKILNREPSSLSQQSGW